MMLTHEDLIEQITILVEGVSCYSNLLSFLLGKKTCFEGEEWKFGTSDDAHVLNDQGQREKDSGDVGTSTRARFLGLICCRAFFSGSCKPASQEQEQELVDCTFTIVDCTLALVYSTSLSFTRSL